MLASQPMNAKQVLKKVIPVEDAISVLHDGDVLATSGYGGHGMPEQLLVALEQRFLATGTPRGLTLVHATGQGDAKAKGLNLLAHDGLLPRLAIEESLTMHPPPVFSISTMQYFIT